MTIAASLCGAVRQMDSTLWCKTIDIQLAIKLHTNDSGLVNVSRGITRRWTTQLWLTHLWQNPLSQTIPPSSWQPRERHWHHGALWALMGQSARSQTPEPIFMMQCGNSALFPSTNVISVHLLMMISKYSSGVSYTPSPCSLGILNGGSFNGWKKMIAIEDPTNRLVPSNSVLLLLFVSSSLLWLTRCRGSIENNSLRSQYWLTPFHCTS